MSGVAAPRARLPLKQGLWALVDQVLSSATNFAMAIIVARLLAPKAYGSFALAMAAWITLLGLVRAAIVHPYVVEAATHDETAWRKSTQQASGAVLLAGIGGGALLIVGGVLAGSVGPTSRCFVLLGVLAPALVLQDFWRFAAFSRDRARAAVANDAVWAVVQAALLVTVVRVDRTPATALGAWGAGAVAGAVMGVFQFRLLPSLSRATLRWARRIAKWGGWFGLSNGLYTGANQLVAVIVAAGAGPAALGGLRAVQTLLGPAQLIAMSGDAVALPAGSRHLAAGGRRGLTAFALRYGGLLNVLLGLYGAVLVLGRHSVVSLVFGPAFLPYGKLVLPLSLGLVATSWSFSGSVGLRSALAGRRLAQAEGIGAVARITCVATLLHFYGVVGAAWGVVAGSLLSATSMWLIFVTSLPTPTRIPAAAPLAAPPLVTVGEPL